MSYLFYIDTKNNAVLHPEVVKLCPSFRALSEKEVLYIVLAFDYNSIYKQHPEHERKRKAMWHVFEDNVPDLLDSPPPRLAAAIEDYISLQYNPKIEVARSYQKKIDDLLGKLATEDSEKGIKELDIAINILQKRINSLEVEVDERTIEEGAVKGDMTLSYLEKIMSNMKHFKSITSKK